MFTVDNNKEEASTSSKGRNVKYSLGFLVYRKTREQPICGVALIDTQLGMTDGNCLPNDDNLLSDYRVYFPSVKRQRTFQCIFPVQTKYFQITKQGRIEMENSSIVLIEVSTFAHESNT